MNITRVLLLIVSAVVLLGCYVGVEGRHRHDAKKAKTSNASVTTNNHEVKADEPVCNRTEGKEPDFPSGPETSEKIINKKAAVPQASLDPRWEFSVTPYAFFAGLDGVIGVRGQRAEVSASFPDIFRNLDFAFMASFEAHKENWSLIGDVMYMSLSGKKVTPNPLFGDIEVQVKERIIDPAVGYRVFKSEGGVIDLLGGARFWHIRSNVTFQPRILPLVDVEGSKSWVDPYVGARGVANISPRLFLNGRFDAGGFGINADFTGQVYAGLGFKVKPNVALVAGYRYIRVDYVNDDFVFKSSTKGLMLGARFKF